MKRWKQYLSLMTAAAMVISGPVIPAKQAKAADAQMVTDTDLSDTEVAEPAAWGATPNAEQLWYMKQGTAAFCHFGPNTFNDVEWGQNYGETAPVNLFTLTKDFDARSLVKAVKEAGFSRLILTAKHHDGFCLWSSEYTDYDIARTNYKNGKGDILEEISDACTEYNLDMGCYLSPWDIYEDKYGCFGDNNNKKNNHNQGSEKGTFTDYNKLYVAWINEICQAKKADGSYKYGNNNPNRRSDRFVEWWMDGAQGDDSNKQTYDWKAILGAITENNPHCQVFGTGKAVNGKNGAEDKALAGTGGIHWIGNEAGWASNETWAKINVGEDYEKLPKSDGAYIGVSEGAQWSVPEVDTKMLAGWFWRDSAGDSTTKSEKELANIYFRTVGRGATLLMNLSPNKEGKVGETQLNRFKEFGSNIQETFDEDFTKEEGVTASATSVWGNSKKFSASKVIDTIPKDKTYDETYWAPADGQTTGSLEINLNGIKKFDVVSIEEYIQKGQTISSFTVEYKDVTGRWHDFGKGFTISAKRLCRSEAVEGTAVRINITGAKATPKICNVGVYKAAKGFEVESSGSIVLPTNLKKIGIREATREGNWTFEADEDGTAQGSAWGNAGVTASFKFTGTKAWVIGTADPNHGNMDVYIDGIKVDTVSTKQTPRKMGALLYTTKELAYGEHTLKLVGASNALGISKIWYADGSGIFSMKQKECDLLYGGTYDVEITRTAGSHGKVTVGYSTQSAGAEQGVNYVNLTGTVTFEDGETSKTITLTGLENDRNADGKDFYFTLMQAENSEASFNTDSYTHVTLYHPNVDKIMERAEEINLADYEAASANAFHSAVSALKDLLFDEKATDEQKKTAMDNLVKAKNELVSTGSTGMVLPTAGGETEVEAEDFTLNPLNNDSANHVHVVERSEASGGKVVDWFKNGDTISMNFYAPAAGQYKVKATYQSGRTEAGGKPNVFSWKGTNVESGSLDVYGEAGATQVHTAEFTINVTQKGHGTLVFEGTEKEGPRIDKFVFSKASEEATGIQINKQKISLSKKDQTERIYVKVNPEDSANQNVTFTTSDNKVATVDEKGNVKAVAKGTADITVRTADGNKTAVCKVTVNIADEPTTVAVTGVTLNKTEATLTAKGQTVQLTAMVAPANATNKNVTYATSNEKVATVTPEGLVTAVAKGTADITVTTADGNKTAVCKVTVNIADQPTTVAVTGVTLDKKEATLTAKGQTEKLTATVAPANATNKNVTYATSNEKVATVTPEGLVTAVAKGTADITVTTADGNKTAVCKVTVNIADQPTTVAVTGVTLDKKEATLTAKGQTEKLTATVAPANATNKNVTYATSNEKVATVTPEGLVTAVAKGTADITVTTADGNKTAVCKVTVNIADQPTTVAVTGVTLDKTKATLTAKGQTVRLTATVAPANATNKNVTYATSNEKVATVTPEGLVTAVAKGTADITVRTADGNKTAVCKVTVSIDDSKTDEPAEVLNQVKDAIKAAENKKQSDYTKETWDAYQKALTDARAAAERAGATKAELEKALNDLKVAETKLVKVSGTQTQQPETPATEAPTAKIPAVGTTKTVGKAIYKVTKSDAKNGTVTLVKLTNKNEKKFTVPASVKVDGISFKVTEISKNAFKNNKKLKQVTVGKNVAKIGANAFNGDSRLKKLTIKSAKLKKVGKKAFKGINAKCRIKVPAKKLTAYKKLLKKKGQKASVKITK